MKKLFAVTLAALATVAAVPALADGNFDGTYKLVEGSRSYSQVPAVNKLEGDTYSCVSCRNPYSIPADGKPHAVEGMIGADSVSVSAPDAKTLVMSWYKDGKVISTETDTVGADPNTLTYKMVDTNPDTGKQVTSTGKQLRVGAADAGVHAATGAWRTVEHSSSDESTYRRGYKVEGNQLTGWDSDGMKYTATLGGDYTTVEQPGTAAKIEIAATMNDANTLTERVKADGVLTRVWILKAIDGGAKQDVTMINLTNGAMSKLEATRVE